MLKKAEFLTAAELKIPVSEYDALLMTLEAFENGTIEPENFSMSFWDNGNKRCIGGWARYLSGYRIDSNFGSSASMLYYPDREEGGPDNYALITIEHAIQALQNYLINGKPNWKEVILF